ncbi:hypothetical protein BDZ89DRAFT_1045059 [Hymenopellis radicata]|nr:hypothetical protein BDZ89DRAFT_1045059 [Hymenopellis radicata]
MHLAWHDQKSTSLVYLHPGQAIICTIHQPSAILVQFFDRLLFLARGGQTDYYGAIGPNSCMLIECFERNGAPASPHDANLAEWMLYVIGAAPGAVAARNFVQAWKASNKLVRVKEELQRKREMAKPVVSL